MTKATSEKKHKVDVFGTEMYLEKIGRVNDMDVYYEPNAPYGMAYVYKNYVITSVRDEDLGDIKIKDFKMLPITHKQHETTKE